MKWAVRLHKQKEGGSLFEHYTKVQNTVSFPETAKTHARNELTAPRLLKGADYYLQLFYDLNSGARRQGMNGFEPFSWVEVEAYLRLTRQSIEPWEVRLVKRMDSAWLQAAASEENS